MKVFLSTILSASLSPGALSSSAHHGAVSKSHEERFQTWLHRHRPYYSHLDDDHDDRHRRAHRKEYELRLEIFAKNSVTVDRHNEAYGLGYTQYAMTLESSPFADVTDDEFRSTHLTEWQNCSATHKSSPQSPLSSLLSNVGTLPESVDWRTKGVITPIKNQGRCGSCWTFSTTGSLEAHTCIHNPDIDCTTWSGLAEQQLLDCASAYDNHGCRGGLPSHAFEYIKDAGGISAEAAYAYNASDVGPCTAGAYPVAARVAATHNVTSRDEDGLVAAVAVAGPVSIAFMVSTDLRFYSHGVYDSFSARINGTVCSSGEKDVNHAVVAVGYGETDNANAVPFFIVRNSWSNQWGMEGYFWMKRGENLCGLSDCASFPIVPGAATALNHLEGEKERDGSDQNDASDVSTITAALRKRGVGVSLS